MFEKVNTGSKALDAFELITAMYAADGYELRKEWFGTEEREGWHSRLRAAMRLPSAAEGVLSGVGNTDFLQAISLFHTRDLREAAKAEGKTGRELSQVSATRQVLLNLPLNSYVKYQHRVEEGFLAAARFLIPIDIYRVKGLPYQSQVVPLAAILAELGRDADSPELLRREEAERTGAYLLLCEDEDAVGDTRCYVGEADVVATRLRAHVKEKSFWNQVVFITWKDTVLPKSHVRYLESRLIELALDGGCGRTWPFV